MLLHSTLLLSTVALLISMGFFTLGSLPLLILKHDKPLDARFIRCVFNTHYVASTGIAAVAASSHALAGHAAMATFALLFASWALFGKLRIVGGMDALRQARRASGAMEVAQFRRLHVTGIAVNVAWLSGFILLLMGVGIV